MWRIYLLILACLPCLAADVHTFKHRAESGDHERITNLGTTNLNGTVFVWYLHEWPVGTNRTTGKEEWIGRVHLVKQDHWSYLVSSRTTNADVSVRQSTTNHARADLDRIKGRLKVSEFEHSFNHK